MFKNKFKLHLRNTYIGCKLPVSNLIDIINHQFDFCLWLCQVSGWQLLLSVLYNKPSMDHQIVVINMHFAHFEF